MQGLFRAAAVVSLLAATACLFGSHKAGTEGGTDDRVRFYVINNYSLAVEVWAGAAGASYRMGLVAPGIVGHFVLRHSMLASGGMVEFVAKPVGTEPLDGDTPF